MKKFLNHFSRVSDSFKYSELGSDACPRRSPTFFSFKLPRSTPAGHLLLLVGEEMQRFVISSSLLRHPIFIQLLDKTAEVYGYDQKGVLQIPCNVQDFEILLAAAKRTQVITPEIQTILDNL